MKTSTLFLSENLLKNKLKAVQKFSNKIDLVFFSLHQNKIVEALFSLKQKAFIEPKIVI